mgnify:CR=1 FL=1
MKNLMVKKAVSALVFALFCVTANAQMKLYSNGQLTIGNTAPYGFYKQTIEGLGMYFKCKTSNFFGSSGIWSDGFMSFKFPDDK